ILRKAYSRALRKGLLTDKAFMSFCRKNKSWLDDYALYMAVKNHYEGKSYLLWDDDIRLREKKAVKRYSELLKDETDFYRFQQFKFDEQWKALKKYANENGIMIIGDIPIYVAPDGADTWSEPELFQLDEKGYPTAVAGCPPDAFTADGQLWGNPLYDWDYHKKTGYKWWMKRLKACFDMYDIVRIDHFRGFYSYWSVPYGDKNARGGKWIKGPGYDFFAFMKKELGDRPVIAEDLGFLTEGVIKMVEKTGYPGMKILQFGFDPSAGSEHVPHLYERNFVVYTGTHDNDTILHWSLNCDKKTAKYVMKYTGVSKRKDLPAALIRECYASCADTCIIPLQDFLELDNEARINTPSTLGDNWKWRSLYSDWTVKLSKRMNKLVRMYGRNNMTLSR
ncbi:MAG: 4-alpha-glucanotransferase, partial [Lachnospiraceae bacterium]|nr:4-alpha-glucanotransferase [Lachnospiraceae bacterium]